jgi:hypothetical protein
LLTIPIVEEPVARDIRRATSGDLYVVRTVWQRALDMPQWKGVGRFDPSFRAVTIPSTQPQPSLWSTNVRVDSGTVMALLDAVRRATLPCHPDRDPRPLDATVYELSFGDDVEQTRYRWSGEPPEGWHPLAHFASRLIELVDDPVGAWRR